MDPETLKQKCPPSQGWDLNPLGNHAIAVNRWGGAENVAHRKPLPPRGTIPIPESWRPKLRNK
jgi:hypothetical protein